LRPVAVRCDLEGAAAPEKWLIHCHIGHTRNNNMEMSGGGGLMMAIEVAEP